MITKGYPRGATRRRSSPPLGNGREDSLSDEALGKLSRGNGPESQGAYAEEDFGAVEQGAYGDEDFDASYQREGEVAASVDPDVAVSAEQQPDDERLRDDLAVQDDVVDVLTTALPIRHLRVEVAYGRVTLDGVVADHSMLGVAEELTSRVPGVIEVVPRLRVEPA